VREAAKRGPSLQIEYTLRAESAVRRAVPYR
jgi:hypothetical protein